MSGNIKLEADRKIYEDPMARFLQKEKNSQEQQGAPGTEGEDSKAATAKAKIEASNCRESARKGRRSRERKRKRKERSASGTARANVESLVKRTMASIQRKGNVRRRRSGQARSGNIVSIQRRVAPRETMRRRSVVNMHQVTAVTQAEVLARAAHPTRRALSGASHSHFGNLVFLYYNR